MDRILIILKKENGPRASSAPALGLNTIIFKYVYWYIKRISGERLQDHWSSGISNPYLTNGFSHHYQLDESTFIYRGVRTSKKLRGHIGLALSVQWCAVSL